MHKILYRSSPGRVYRRDWWSQAWCSFLSFRISETFHIQKGNVYITPELTLDDIQFLCLKCFAVVIAGDVTVYRLCTFSRMFFITNGPVKSVLRVYKDYMRCFHMVQVPYT